MSETEVEVEDYEEIVGDLYYDDSVEAVPTADSFQEPTLNQNVSSLTPKNRPILRPSNLSLAGDLQESIPKVVILCALSHGDISNDLDRPLTQFSRSRHF